VQFLLSSIQASPAARQQHQEQLKQASSLSKAGQWLQLLCLLAPRWQHLLLSAAAVHHSGVLAALLQDLSASKKTAAAPARPSCSSHSDHHQLVAGHVTEPPASASSSSNSSSNSQQPSDASQQQQQQQQQAASKHPLFTTELSSALRLPTYRHDQLQSAVVSAAAAGQAHSLALLLRQLTNAGCRNISEQVDLACSAMEAAAAAGSSACLQLLWNGRPPAPLSHCSCSSSSSSGIDRLQEEQQLVTATLQQLQLERCNLLQQHLLCSSRYCLVAAASSGNAQLLQGLLQNMPQGSGLLVTQQLPAALQEAGKRGHVAALQLLLGLQEISSRPLQVCCLLSFVHDQRVAFATLLTSVGFSYQWIVCAGVGSRLFTELLTLLCDSCCCCCCCCLL
jgi:hypothetical protein